MSVVQNVNIVVFLHTRLLFHIICKFNNGNLEQHIFIIIVENRTMDHYLHYIGEKEISLRALVLICDG